ncbi:hypothetical protein [Bacillus cereus]|uniref:Uncharacterized protein n=2 Tax=Bacillus cereus TaxID=1396 RepID=J8BR07_BACCE|nr:hypothetical protein [Bacillus cereus]EJQ96298.1 hypothetical protein II3_04404 [Bacillus cereus MC67]EOO96549.1 hypothetical protein II1_05709 [Bacillus cereus MC118]
MQGLMLLCLLAFIIFIVMLVIAAIKKKEKKKLVISAISCFVLFIVFASLSPKPEQGKKKDVKVTATEAKQDETKKKNEEDQKKADEQKKVEEQRKQDEDKKKQEQQKTAVNTDKSTYENELKPKIDSMIKEYDEIWNQEWRPIWGEASKDPASVDQNALKEKMEAVTNRYDELSNKNTVFKDGAKLSDPVLKEKIEKFRGEFGLATNYRSNAGRAVTQGMKGIAPLKGRMEEAQKSIKISDQKLINALANLTEVESKLGVSRN